MKKNLNLDQKIKDLEEKLKVSEARELRALADYQNLIKRTREEKLAFAKMANRELVAEILEPLEHLSLAALQLKDQGLDMIVKNFWQKLEAQGLEEILPQQGQNFDEKLMEAVLSQGKNIEGKVERVMSKGYRLNGEVICHAKVAIS